ncbi:MAG: lipoprotein-releasing ABC transporter permease subunit [Algicola sp.]|nr:lipoprotein-releasing ABC transporter permease subunit [Algicola sp.]
MFQPLSLFIGLRYSRANKGNSFISFISFFSIAGIALGVLSLIVVVSVMNGFEAQLKDKILGVIPQVIVSTDGNRTTKWQGLIPELKKHPQINNVQPFVQSQSMIQSSSALEGVMLQGVFKDYYAPIKSSMVIGSWDSLYSKKYGVIVGHYLASKLKVSVGDRVRIMVAGASNYTPIGRMPRNRKFTVVGIFNTGSEIDDKVIFSAGKDAAKLLKLKNNDISGIRLYLEDAFAAPEVSKSLSEQHPEFTITDWRQSYGKLFSAVKMEKRMMWIMLGLIIAVAAFNIVSALVMMVTEKQGEVAILKTQGLDNVTVQKIFMVQGLYNGVWGALSGAVLGVVISIIVNPVLDYFSIDIIGAGYGGLPILMNMSEVVIIALSAIGLSFVATLYPAYKAATIKPVEVLRYE